MNKVTLSGLMLFFMFVTLLQAAMPGPQSSTPALHSFIGSKKLPLTLSVLKVDAKISGLLAETKMTMTFYNPYDQDVEGRFTFPLPDGAFVSGYGLDVNGRMVEGVVVEKDKGRLVFEEIVRQGIDPGLTEWVNENSFKTSVYPIPANKTRTIMVRYISELNRVNSNAQLHLPLNYNITVKKFSLKVQIMGPTTGLNNKGDAPPPAWAEGIGSFHGIGQKACFFYTLLKGINKKGSKKGSDDFQMNQWQNYGMAETSKTNFLMDKDINIPVPIENANTVYVEKNPDGKHYFTIHPVHSVHSVHSVKPGKTKHITILWDASGSRGNSHHKNELLLLKRYFSSFKNRTIMVDFKVFRFQETKTLRFDVKGGNAKALLKAIKSLHYDGATSLNTIFPTAKEKKPDFYLLFSDGNHNFGEWTRGTARFKRQVYVIASAGGSNHEYLRNLAESTGGKYLLLTQKENRQIHDILGPPVYTFISATAGKDSVKELYPKSPQPAELPLTVSGILVKNKATVTLNYGINGKILKKNTYKVLRKKAAGSNIIRTFQAQEKIRRLMKTPNSKNALIETGKKY
ncbi:MAG: hypothetical protein GY757_53810, partial [bacterium]|nr:hypothetical protein [bacterium]